MKQELKKYLTTRSRKLHEEKDLKPSDEATKASIDGRIEEINNLAAKFQIKIKKKV